MKKYKFLPILLCAALALSACGSTTDGSTAGSSSGSTSADSTSTESGSVASYDGDYSSVTAEEADPVHAADAEDATVEITGDFTITSEDADVETAVTVSGNTYTITAAGEYTLSGLLSEGRVIVDAPEDAEVTLILNSVSITCSTASPVYISQASEVKIKSEEGTYNEITDARAQKASSVSAADETDEDSAADEDAVTASETGNAAIWSSCDLHLTGKGALVVNASYNNGIQTKDDLKIKNVTLKVTAAGNALKGSDSVTVESGELILIAESGDGIKTSNTEVSSKGNQKGCVTIEGGNIDIYAACDGIDAAYDALISGEGNLNIYTDSYSDYSSGAVQGGTDFYLILSTSDYSEDQTWYGYFYNDDRENGVWAKAEYNTMVYSGRTSYYGLMLSMPSGYENMAFFAFDGDTEPSLTDYAAASEGDTVNKSQNGWLVSSMENGTVSGDSVTLQSGMGGGNSEKTEYSTKGIKADNEVVIDGGIITIYCKDDGIHANSDVTLESGDYGTGNVTVNGGTITITAADDGIHADNELTIGGGTINVAESYEGLEGNLVTINGGTTFVYASDDAVNASAGSSTPLVSVNGGYLEVETPSGDTDAIDSNGNYEQTGGYVIVKGGASTGSMAGSLDVDGSIKVDGGAVVCVGGICETPTDSDCNAYAENGTSLSAGSYELTDSDGNVILSFTLDTTYSSFWIASEKLEADTEYTLTADGSTVSSWTQEEGTTGAAAQGFGGMGGFGGGRR